MTNRGGGRSRAGGRGMGAGHCKNSCKNRRAARAKVKKRNETWEKTQHQPQSSGQMGKWAKEVQGGGRGLPGMAPAHATRCGSSAASIEIPNNRVECTCTACAATRHKKKQKVKREESPKTKILREKMQKCATKRSEIRGRGWGERVAALVGGAIKKRVSSSPKLAQQNAAAAAATPPRVAMNDLQ